MKTAAASVAVSGATRPGRTRHSDTWSRSAIDAPPGAATTSRMSRPSGSAPSRAARTHAGSRVPVESDLRDTPPGWRPMRPRAPHMSCFGVRGESGAEREAGDPGAPHCAFHGPGYVAVAREPAACRAWHSAHAGAGSRGPALDPPAWVPGLSILPTQPRMMKFTASSQGTGLSAVMYQGELPDHGMPCPCRRSEQVSASPTGRRGDHDPPGPRDRGTRRDEHRRTVVRHTHRTGRTTVWNSTRPRNRATTAATPQANDSASTITRPIMASPGRPSGRAPGSPCRSARTRTRPVSG